MKEVTNEWTLSRIEEVYREMRLGRNLRRSELLEVRWFLDKEVMAYHLMLAESDGKGEMVPKKGLEAFATIPVALIFP